MSDGYWADIRIRDEHCVGCRLKPFHIGSYVQQPFDSDVFDVMCRDCLVLTYKAARIAIDTGLAPHTCGPECQSNGAA